MWMVTCVYPAPQYWPFVLGAWHGGVCSGGGAGREGQAVDGCWKDEAVQTAGQGSDREKPWVP